MKITLTSILFLTALISSDLSYGQWNLNADNHTTARLSIGTTSYSDKLSIEGTGEWHIRLKDKGTGGQDWRLGSSSTAWAAGGGKFIISNSLNSINASFVIDGQRNIGIGTTVPKSRLHVYDGDYRDYYVNRNIPGNTEDGQGINYILLHKAYVSTLLDESYVMGKLSAIRGGTGALNRKVSVELNTSSAYNSNRGSVISYNEGVRLVLLTFNSQRYVAVEIANGSMVYGLSFTGYAFNETFQLVYDQSVSNVADFTSLDNVFIQASAVGIGTKTPDAKLTVKGNIHAEEVKVDLTVPAPDYVFETSYNLSPLKEVEAFIQQNKHLPEIPAAKEMEQNGINLSEMNMLLLKKVEELTLHLIEQEKKMEMMKKEIDAIKNN
jgi:hypothetical protein